VKRLSALFCVIAVFQATRVLADPLPAPTSEASKIDIMGLRLGLSPDEIKPILEAAQPGIQVKVQESTWPDGTRYVSKITGNWSIPNKNNSVVISRGELLDVHFSTPALEISPSGLRARQRSMTVRKYPKKLPFRLW
jgi:hypothetical protein